MTDEKEFTNTSRKWWCCFVGFTGTIFFANTFSLENGFLKAINFVLAAWFYWVTFLGATEID